jgi:hypothetical protein
VGLYTVVLRGEVPLCARKHQMQSLILGALALLVAPSDTLRVDFGRRTLIRRMLTLPVMAPLVQPAVAGEPARKVSPDESFYQVDDKSFDFIVPKGWVVPEAGFMRSGENPRRYPDHLFKVTGRSGSGDSIEVTVDLGYGTGLADLGAPEAAAQRLLALLPSPPAQLKSVEKVPGTVKGSSFLFVRAADGRSIKAAVIQKRLFAMAASGPGAEEVLDTFQAWPINIFCQGASNSGGPIPTGTCY